MCDKLFLTCCALHNFLLDKDGLDKNWECGDESFWNKDYANNLVNEQIIQTHFSIKRLNRKISDRTKECFNKKANDAKDMSKQCQKYTVDGKRVVSKMPLSLFQNCLVNHFDIQFKENSIVWPRHIKK